MSTIKKNEIPKKGDIIKAVYVVGGVQKRTVDLGTVKEANTKSFVDGMGITRAYNFDAVNGVRLIGFAKPKKEKKETEEE